jgi:hypothetical protein
MTHDPPAPEGSGEGLVLPRTAAVPTWRRQTGLLVALAVVMVQIVGVVAALWVGPAVVRRLTVSSSPGSGVSSGGSVATSSARPSAGSGSGAAVLARVIVTPGSGMLAMALNPLRLGFLVVVGPLLAAFLVVFAVLAAVAGRRTGGRAVPVMLRALTLGWILSVTFPLMG